MGRGALVVYVYSYIYVSFLSSCCISNLSQSTAFIIFFSAKSSTKFVSLGENRVNMASPNLLNISNSPQKVQLVRIAHIYQKHPDLQKWEVFAKDFGFVEAARQGGKIYFRGYGKDPYCVVASASENGKKEFGGAAFIAKTEEDFAKAMKIPGAKLVDISSAPGGGKMVSIPTPTDNFIHVIWGQVERNEPRSPPSTIKVAYKELNTSLEKIRQG